jgi:membrane dipeptidase
VNRREFFSTGGLALASAPWVSGRASAYARADYDEAWVIDALGAPGELDPNVALDAPLSARALADVKASGVTALNVTVTVNGPREYEGTLRTIARYEREIADHPDVFTKVRSARDLEQAKRTHRVGLIYGFQDSTVLGNDPTHLAMFHALGVRIVQPTYNARNLMGDGCMEPANAGLSMLGRELIAEINRLNIVLDLSHAGPRTIAEGIAASKVPMAISHTGCRALVDVPRNVHDRELKALADRGGVVGIYHVSFLRSSGQPHSADLIRHLQHALNVCGEDHVGIGTDGRISGARLDEAFTEYTRKRYEARKKAGIASPGEAPDVFNLIPEYNEPRRMLSLATDLDRLGWPTERIEKILGGNFRRLFSEVWRA